jgi:cellulose synthase/poly-beta-1,6-N-acetylglucosamine synthase-like glycosyltransferase
MKLWKLSGVFLSVTGVLHTGVALVTYRRSYERMLSDGLFNSLSDSHGALAFWFLTIGVLLLLIGQTLSYYIKREQQPAPLFLGYTLLVFSMVGCVIVPISGFWLFLPQALIIIMAKRNYKY